MTGRLIWKVLFALVIIAGLVLGGAALYQMGFTHGAMTNITLPEDGEFPMLPHGRVPFGYVPLGWHAVPRVGLLGILPLLCFAGFFFLVLMFGFGFMARKRAWRHYGSGWQHEYWKHHGPPPWGPGKPPWAGDQAQTESDTPSAETEETES